MAQPSQVPVRYTSGVSTDFPFGPLANYGLPNPFFYHTWADDFDTLNELYTKTVNTNGTVAPTAGPGGLLLFTTNSSTPLITDIASIQLPAAGFSHTAGKKLFFLTRLQLSSISNAAFRVGLLQTTTTPFTATDGIFFDKPTGALTGLALVSVIGSVATTLTIPTSAYTLANATNIDLSFHINRNSEILAYVGSQLVGWVPPSSTTGGHGAVARFAPSITTANLNPTLAVQSGTAASSTMTIDFAMAAKER